MSFKMALFNVEDKQNLATKGEFFFPNVKVEVSKVDIAKPKQRFLLIGYNYRWKLLMYN